jgi:hypothetical protein
MKPIQIISQDVFDKVRSRFSNLEMGDETGAVTIDPAQARFFDFDFIHEGNNLGRVSISLNDLGSLKVYYSQGITENQDTPVKQTWYDFLKEMRFFAMRRLLRFDTRDIAKNNLDRNDFQHLAATQGPKEEEPMNTVNESRWNHKSSRKTSRAVQGRTEVIVRHHKPVDEDFAGSRSQRKNIKAIFIQNRDGERFKYPFIHPAGAFAMAQHVDHGGIPHDPAGKAIIRMSEEIAQLGEFQRKIQRTSLHDDAMGITERAVGRLTELKAKIDALGKKHHYESWLAEFNEQEHMDDDIMELDAVTMEEYKSKFTQSSFQEELAGYFPLLHRIMSETNKVDLEDFVKEESDVCPECKEDPCVCDDHVKEDAFDAFTEWAEAVEQGKLTDEQIKELKQGLSELPQGSNGPELDFETAYNFFSQYGIDDEDLKDAMQDEKKRDEEIQVPPIEVFKVWAKENYPELLVALGMSNTQAPAEPAPEQPTAETVEKTKDSKQGMIKMIAEKVKSFYNRDNPEVGPFRGGENIAMDVKKSVEEQYGPQAGEQAYQMAEALIEKLTNEWQQRHGQVNKVDDGDGLARLKELVGNIKAKVEGMETTTDEGLGTKILGGAALLASLWGVNNHLANQAYEASPQLQKLTQFYKQAEANHDTAKMQELERRIENHKARLDLGYGDVMDKTGNPKDIVPEMADILKLSGLAK